VTREEKPVPPPHVWVYSESSTWLSVCAAAELDAAAVAAALRRQRPMVPGHVWNCSSGQFEDGTASPASCNREPEGRRHWLAELAPASGVFPWTAR
jgi:hypothetical protein